MTNDQKIEMLLSAEKMYVDFLDSDEHKSKDAFGKEIETDFVYRMSIAIESAIESLKREDDENDSESKT